MQLVEEGENVRIFAETQANKKSSRSHTIFRIQISPSHNKGDYGSGVGVANVKGICGYKVHDTPSGFKVVDSSFEGSKGGSLNWGFNLTHRMNGSGKGKADKWVQQEYVIRMDSWKYNKLSSNKKIKVQTTMELQQSNAYHLVWNQGCRQTIQPHVTNIN